MFIAKAYEYSCEALDQEINTTGKGRGLLATMLRITIGKYNEAQIFLRVIGGSDEFDQNYRKVQM